MFSRNIYKYFGIRVEFMKLGMGTYYLWDKEREQLVMAAPWQHICMYAGFYGGGCFFVAIHLIRLYINSHVDEIPEEGATGPPPVDLRAFATVMIEWGEVLLVSMLSLLNAVFLKRVNTFMYLFNQLLDYNKKLTEMVESGKLVLTSHHKLVIRLVESIVYAVMVISVVLPFFVTGSIKAKIEPTHQLIREWLEVDFAFNLGFSPLIGSFMMAGYGVGTTVSLMMNIICLYFIIATVCTDGFTPEAIKWTPKEGPGRCKLETKCFGTLSDMEVIYLYRTQQVLNILLNTFFKSVLIAFHHVGCLATVVVLLVFMIRFDAVLSEYGLLGYVIVTSSAMVPLVMIYFQAKMAGAVVNVSDDFKFSGKQLAGRKLLFRKFSRCCQTFYIQVAYPFYTVHKETFTMFCEQAQDYSMELLLMD